MDPEALAVGRDLALILLIIEAAILAVPLLIIPYLILRYLPRVRAPMAPNLRRIWQTTSQVEQATKAIMGTVVQPFIWTAATGAALRRALEHLARRR